MKFVPASGSATRMFSFLISCLHAGPASWEEARLRASEGDNEARSLLLFLEALDRLPFFHDWESVLVASGHDLRLWLREGRVRELLENMLTPRGLDCANRPKGLLKFHRYPDGARTAFEEHLIEATHYVKDRAGTCRLHFTVSPEHRDGFQRLWESVRERYEARCGVRFRVNFSVQSPSTDTIAVDSANRPFRLNDGSLLFRPAGHGALISNLNELRGDIVFVKNIDNVVPESRAEPTARWKQVLGGYLVKVQNQVFSILARLADGPPKRALLGEGLEFAREYLGVPAPARGQTAGSGLASFLRDWLHRPLRVCGVVRNQGEPGGGPFWVEALPGVSNLQIVESVQVDMNSFAQRGIWESATHFNPVDIVCGLRDREGQPFDLERFVDGTAVLIARKSKDGRELKALELPGLWNGAMAGWNTIFVEVPLATFNPVKTVQDLLRPEHQP
jgi:hypothetical protein